MSDSLIEDIVLPDHHLVELRKVINREGINGTYESCCSSDKGDATESTGLVRGLLSLKHLYKEPGRVLINELHVNHAYVYGRALITERFYEVHRAIDCEMLRKLSDDYGIMHVVPKSNQFDNECDILHESCKDDKYGVYRINIYEVLNS